MAKKLNAHLTRDDRDKIEMALENDAYHTAIAETLGKDKSTICKEVKKHRELIQPKYGRSPNGVYDCEFIKECGLKFCIKPYNRYQRVRCSRRDRTVGVCNGCEYRKECKKTKFIYKAEKAQNAYEYDLKDARSGLNLSSSQAKQLGDLLAPLVKQGQSIYVILKNHPEIPYCERTIYNYISDGVFAQSELKDIDLLMKTRRRPTKRKKEALFKPRNQRAYLKGRSHNDFIEYITQQPNAKVVEMDTIYNDQSGPFLQTFQFVDLMFMSAFIHPSKTIVEMVAGIKQLKEMLGDNLFKQHVQIIKTDRGSEFTAAEEMEKTGVKVFYCYPQCSWQKPHVENNHLLLRRIITNSLTKEKFSLFTQADINVVFSHINSYPREELHDKSPIDVMLFFNHDKTEMLNRLMIKKINPDSVIMNPSLLNKVKV